MVQTETHEVLDLGLWLAPLLQQPGFEPTDDPSVQRPLEVLAQSPAVAGQPASYELVQVGDQDVETDPPFAAGDLPNAVLEAGHGLGMGHGACPTGGVKPKNRK